MKFIINWWMSLFGYTHRCRWCSTWLKLNVETGNKVYWKYCPKCGDQLWFEQGKTPRESDLKTSLPREETKWHS